jgi:DNA repair protein RecN (Recombination protein N)
MLQELLIRNFTIIDKISVSFHQGLNVITGETGAGKSIILDALDFVLGGRFDGKILRTNASECEVTAIFTLTPDQELSHFTQETGIDFSHGECYLKRVLSREGRSRAFINDSPVTLQKLKQLGLYLVQFYGQHEHQTLLKAETQLALVDRYGGKHAPLLEKVAALFHEQQKLAIELSQLKEAANKGVETNKLLQYQLEELTALNLTEAELPKLYAEQKQLANAQELIQQSAEVLNNLRDQEPSVLGMLKTAQKDLSQFKEFAPKLHNAQQLVTEAYTLVEEACFDVRDFHEHLELDPEKLAQVESRIDALHALARKHHVKPEDLLSHYQDLQRAQNKTLNLDGDIKNLSAQLEKTTNTYLQEAKKLTKAREKTVATLSEQVNHYIHKLGMPQGKFNIQLIAQEAMHAQGMDEVSFRVRLNPGQAEAAMNEVASGGELSRIGLAIALLTGQTALVPTLIFDEVDVGVSGAVAEMIGQLLRDLGQKMQVVSVTHLAQVAVYAHQHVLVEKHQSKTSTTTSATLLDFKGRAQALAQILSGTEVTKEALKHAEEWLKKIT